jgi:hypothetical protein
MRPQQWERVNERVDRAERPGVRSIEPYDDTCDRTRSEADANEMPRLEHETVGHRIGERARWAANAGEDRDLGGTRGHNS